MIYDMYDCHGLPRVYETEIRFKNGYGYTRPWLGAVCSLDIKTGMEWFFMVQKGKRL